MTTTTDVSFRYATRDDLPAIVGLLADDEKGKTREELTDPLPDAYTAAFEAMESQSTDALPNKYLLALQGTEIVGCLQLTLIAGLSRRGQLRAQIEGVRVASTARGQKIGEKLIASLFRFRNHSARHWCNSPRIKPARMPIVFMNGWALSPATKA